MSPPLDYVGSPDRPALDAVRALLDGADDVFAAVAYVTRPGVELIKRELREVTRGDGRLRVLTTFDFGLTEPDALDTLVDLGAEVRIAELRKRAYHPKVFLGARRESRSAMVGSTNLTVAAMLANVEASVAATGREGARVHEQARAQLEPLWSSDEVAPYRYGTKAVELLPRPRVVDALRQRPGGGPSVGVAERGELGVFPVIWRAIEELCAQRDVVTTAKGKTNRLLGFDSTNGVLVGTEKSPDGQRVPPWMFRTVAEAVILRDRMPLQAKGQADCTNYLRVMRSSAVAAVLAALPWFDFERERRRTMLAWRGWAAAEHA